MNLTSTTSIHIEFEVDIEEFSDYMITALKESDEEYKQRKTSPGFTNVEVSFKWLDK